MGLSSAGLPLDKGEQACSQITPRWNRLHRGEKGSEPLGCSFHRMPLRHRSLSKEPKARTSLTKPCF